MARLIQDNSDEWVLRSDWYIDDIKFFAESKGITLNDDECLNVMRKIAKHYDANVGINWEVVNFYIDNL